MVVVPAGVGAVAVAVVWIGPVGTTDFAEAGLDASGLNEGSELNIESLRSAYPLICSKVSHGRAVLKKLLFT